MKLRRLDVEYFAGIRSAKLEFAPGLNVLHAPNEIGKSSLLLAIRAALLLQAGARAHHDFIDWHSDQAPRVRLEFETEPQRIWRVDKSFGSGGSSYLEFSKDGTSFSRDAKGREVDGRIRALLEWGVPSPGGSSRTHGYPVSFLTKALLGEQGEVDAVLSQGLHGDLDDSGRKRLTAALQALAEDPVFRRVMEKVRERVGEAFSATGRKRTGKNSPWQQLKERRLAAEQRREELRQQLEESEGARQSIMDQQREVDQERERLADAKTIHERIEIAWSQSDARSQAQARLNDALIEHQRIQKLHGDLHDTESELVTVKSALKDAEGEHERYTEATAEAVRKFDAARSVQRDIRSGESEQKRQLEIQKQEKALLALDARRQTALQKQRRAERVRDLGSRVAKLGGKVDKRAGELEASGAELARLETEIGEATNQREIRQRADLAQTWIRAQDAFETAEQERNRVEVWRRDAAVARQNASMLEDEVAALALPSAEELAELKELDVQMRVADRDLAVGLSVRVEPHGKLVFDVVEDGESTEHILDAARVFEARAEISLKLPGVDVHVTGGTTSARAEATALRERWHATAQPFFARTKSNTLSELEEQVANGQEKLQQAADAVNEASNLEAKAEGAGDIELELSRTTETLTAAGAALDLALPDGTTREEARTLAAEHRDGDEDSDGLLSAKRIRVSELKQQIARDEAFQESESTELQALKHERDEAATDLSNLTNEWNEVLEQVQGELEEVQGLRSDAEHALTELANAADSELGEADEAVEAADNLLTAARQAEEAALKARDEARQNSTRLEERRNLQQKAVAQEELAVAEEAVSARQAELDELPVPEQEISDEQREKARGMVDTHEESLRVAEDALRKFEGGLEQVGGDYINEQMKHAEEAVEAVLENEHEKELDFGAWKLLEETMKDAEAEASVHLGKVLVDPIEKRMSELTGGRYGAPSIGPKLGTDGITLAGASRPLERLSVGTREQLATLLRLTIAEKLGTVLILDDQLVQSDPDRMCWLVTLMTECATAFQILVLTCRPHEYAIGDDNRVTMIDLAAHVQRTDGDLGATPGTGSLEK